MEGKSVFYKTLLGLYKDKRISEVELQKICYEKYGWVTQQEVLEIIAQGTTDKVE